jgi:hypothetical protein
MCSNELLRSHTIEGSISISLARIHIRTDSDFEMQMCQIGTPCRSHGAYFFASLNLLPSLDENGLQMRIHRLHHWTELILVWKSMRDEDHFAPARAGTASIDHPAGPCGVDSLSQIGVSTANAVQIITQMA